MVSGGGSYIGALDEVKVWNVARTKAEIMSSFRRKMTGYEPGLAVYWSFDDNIPGVII